ncbi:MAG TPA: hypothetical protein VI636_03920 [Candidatus Angelobacter sp.]
MGRISGVHHGTCPGLLRITRSPESYPIPRSADDSSGVPQTRQITAEQSPHVRGSFTSRAQLGQ